MGWKVRKHIHIEVRLEKMLKRRGKELDLSEVELIRQGLDVVLARGEGPVLDPQAWDEERGFIRERAKIPALGGERACTREELYDERLSRCLGVNEGEW